MTTSTNLKVAAKILVAAVMMFSSASFASSNCKHASGAGLMQATAATSTAIANSTAAGSVNQ